MGFFNYEYNLPANSPFKVDKETMIKKISTSAKLISILLFAYEVLTLVKDLVYIFRFPHKGFWFCLTLWFAAVLTLVIFLLTLNLVYEGSKEKERDIHPFR